MVHRPKYDDWSFPKGKVERGEHRTAAAVREVAEETGLHVRLGLPLDDQHYRVSSGDKTVHYWVGRVVGSNDVGRYRPNAEVDRVAWVDVERAAKRLSYPHDAATLAEAVAQQRKTRTLVLARHALARSRRTWRGADERRPLLAAGAAQSQRLVPVLAAYDARRLVTSPSLRCVQTMTPYAETTGRRLDRDKRLSERSGESPDPEPVRGLVEEILSGLHERPASQGAVVLCSHRPVLPQIYESLGLPDPVLAPGQLLVVHLRAGAVVTAERHRPG